MFPELLDEISQSQRERIFHIDFLARFLGTLNRNDLVSRFGIKEAAATRDIAHYRRAAPDNLEYDPVSRSYNRASTYEALFRHTSEKALLLLTANLGIGEFLSTTPLINSVALPQLSIPNIDILAEITTAIHQRRPVEIEYFSTSSGKSNRTIIPFCLASNGTRWHVRAYDRKSTEFRDFVLTRIDAASLSNGKIEEHEKKQEDHQWNRVVDLEIVPHPSMTHPETIIRDFNMKEGVLNLQVRAVMVGYLLRRWNVDCSQDHSLKGSEYHLWLRNTPTLYGVSNLRIAPGYDKSGL